MRRVRDLALRRHVRIQIEIRFCSVPRPSGGCLLSLSGTDFNSCDTVRSTVSSIQATFIAVTHVGTLGNADTSTLSDWLEITNATAPSVTTSDSSGTCSSILSDVTLQIIYTFAGSKDVPQRKIVGARFTYTYSNWSMSCSSVSCQTSSATQNFLVSTHVDFIFSKEEQFAYQTPSLPTFINSADTDIFYVFRQGFNSGADEYSVVTYTLWVIGIAVVSLLACMEH